MKAGVLGKRQTLTLLEKLIQYCKSGALVVTGATYTYFSDLKYCK